MANSINANMARQATVPSDLFQVTGTLIERRAPVFPHTVVKPRTQLVTGQLSRRRYLRQEPDAVVPLVRIRRGGCEQS